MSVHVEWMEAHHTTVEALHSGDEVGENKVTQPYALAFSADECVVIEGDFDQLERLLESALRQLRKAAGGGS